MYPASCSLLPTSPHPPLAVAFQGQGRREKVRMGVGGVVRQFSRTGASWTLSLVDLKQIIHGLVNFLVL